MNARRNGTRRLRTEILNVRIQRNLIHRGSLRGRTPRHGRLGELLVNLKLLRLIGNGRIGIVPEVKNRGTLSDGAGSNRGKAEHCHLIRNKP